MKYKLAYIMVLAALVMIAVVAWYDADTAEALFGLFELLV